MRRGLRFVLPILLVLGCLSAVATSFVGYAGRRWFERDVALRSHLVERAAEGALVAHWNDTWPNDVEQTLGAITHGHRMLAAEACRSDGTILAETLDFPARLHCLFIEEALSQRTKRGFDRAEWLDGESLFVSVIPIAIHRQRMGFVVLVHDFGYADRGADLLMKCAGWTCAALSFVSALFTLIGMRVAERTRRDAATPPGS